MIKVTYEYLLETYRRGHNENDSKSFCRFTPAHGFESHRLRQPKARHRLTPCSCFFVRYDDLITNKVTYAKVFAPVVAQAPPNPIVSANKKAQHRLSPCLRFLVRYDDLITNKVTYAKVFAPVVAKAPPNPIVSAIKKRAYNDNSL